MSNFYKKLSDIKNMYLINKSGYFDKGYYKKEYVDVNGNPLKHYYYLGYKLGYNPSVKFNNDYYLKSNPDISSAMINPLLHYIICGKDEGRKIIQDKGFSISELYNYVCKDRYNYNLYKTNDDLKRINIFVDNILKDNYKEFIPFFKCIFKRCNEKGAVLRIFYTDIDIKLINELFELCKEDKITIPSVDYISISDNNLLEFGNNEVVFCTSYSSMFALVNSNYINLPIYYLVKDYEEFNLERRITLSLLVHSGKVKCVSFDNLVLKNYNLKIVSDKKIEFDNIDSLVLEFNDLFILGIDIINNCFEKLDCNFDIYYKFEKCQKKFYLNNDKVVIPVKDVNDKMGVTIKFFADESKVINDNDIWIYFEETDKELDYVKVLDDDFFKKSNVIGNDLMLDNLLEDIFIVGEK